MADGKGGGSKWCPSFLPVKYPHLHQHSDETASRNTMRRHTTVLLLWIAAGISLLQFALFKIRIDVNFQMERVYWSFFHFFSAQHLSDVKTVRNGWLRFTSVAKNCQKATHSFSCCFFFFFFLEEITVKSQSKGILLKCGGSQAFKETDRLTELQLDYKDENSREYECVNPNDEEDSSKIYVKFRSKFRAAGGICSIW